MTFEFLVLPVVREVLFRLIWGDRFESDLETNLKDSDIPFSEIRNRLLEEDMVFQLKGDRGNPYLSLTDKGIAVVNRLYEIERILEGEDVDTE